MDLGLALGVAGVVLTIAFGGWGVYLTVRTRYPGRITVFVEDTIPLFEAIVRSVPDLTVSFRGVPVEPGLVLTKLIVANDGGIDINPNMVDEPLALTLPEGFRWLAANVIATSPKVTAQIDHDNQRVKVSTSLFRRDEFIRLDLIAAVPTEVADAGKGQAVARRFRKAITAAHRIANTQKARIRDLGTDAAAQRHVRSFARILAVGVLGFVGLAFLEFREGLPAELQYRTDLGSAGWVEAHPKRDGTVLLKPIKGGNKSSASARSFFTSRVRDVRVKRPTFGIIAIYALATLYVGLPAAGLLYAYVQRRRIHRINDFIAPAAKDSSAA